MQTFIKRFVTGESGVTAYGVIAATLMLVGIGAWAVATAPRVVASTQINPLEMMANARNLPNSLVAQSATDSGAARNATAPGSNLQTSTWSHSGAKHDAKLYMSAKSTHKHKRSEPAPQVSVP